MNTKTFLFAAMLLFFFSSAHSQTTNENSSGMSKNAEAFFNGAFQSTNNKAFSVMDNGYFNTVSQDSTGKWEEVHAGSYTVNNDNTITFKILYSSYPDHIGALNTAEYIISGETLKMRHFKKLIDAQGDDITAQMPKDAWETFVKLK